MTSEIILSFCTLSLLEIVLGIDNLVFISLLVQNLSPEFRDRARYIGISLALIIRIIMLLGASWIMKLTHPLFSVMHHAISVKDLLLLSGGVFLLVKTGMEIYKDFVSVSAEEEHFAPKSSSSMLNAVFQITLIDFVFSFDSIITAVGMTSRVDIIIAAVIVSMVVMLFASAHVSRFLENYPSFKTLALSFVFLIGIMLFAEGFHYPIPRGYIYACFAFSLCVEFLNLQNIRKKKLN